MVRCRLFACCAVAGFALGTLSADGTPLPPVFKGAYIGQLRQYRVRKGESLIELARRFDLGFIEIRDANPGVDPVLPKPGTVVTIPTAWIPPAVPEGQSIVVNLAELRLYYFDKAPSQVMSYPIGIGDEGTQTPVGNFFITEKLTKPSWHVPRSIRRQRPELPEVMPPGPRNPLGSHALRLSRADILIHGTNRPWGIGRRSSHGCLRLYSNDIAALFAKARTGMRVMIIDQPLKIGVEGDKVFLELHGAGKDATSAADVLHIMADRGLLHRVDMGKLVRAVYERRGYPVDISWSHK